MEKTFARVEELADTVKDYVNTRIESAKLSIAEKSSAVIANLVAGLLVVTFFILFFLFGSIAMAFGLGEWIGKTWSGFLIVSGFYLLVGIVVWIARVKIIQLPVMNALIKQLFGEED
jgi:hypothetical protein